MSGQLQAQATLSPGTEPVIELFVEYGNQSRSGDFGEEVTLLALPRIEPRVHGENF